MPRKRNGKKKWVGMDSIDLNNKHNSNNKQ